MLEHKSNGILEPKTDAISYLPYLEEKEKKSTSHASHKLYLYINDIIGQDWISLQISFELNCQRWKKREEERKKERKQNTQKNGIFDVWCYFQT